MKKEKYHYCTFDGEYGGDRYYTWPAEAISTLLAEFDRNLDYVYTYRYESSSEKLIHYSRDGVIESKE